jgi:hypothetical protein
VFQREHEEEAVLSPGPPLSFLRLSPDAIGHADRAQRRAEVNSAPTKAGTPQVTDGWFLLHGDCEIPSGTLGFEIATGKNITVCFV